jgi:uncharacterized protein YndB with AHSA1/START domain
MIAAEDGKQDITITREFDLPADLLFRAHVDPEIVEQWMGTKVLKLEARKHGSYLFETTDPKGNKHRFHGTIHELIPDQQIIRTFEMETAPFGVQMEIYTFEKLTGETSRLRIHSIYESASLRDQMLKLPFKQGLNMAHNRLQTTAAKYRQSDVKEK